MKRIFLFIVISFLSALFPWSRSEAATVQVDVVHSQERYAAGREYPLALRITIEKPWSVHGTEAGKDQLIPTVLRFENAPGLSIHSVRFPSPQKVKFGYASDPVEVFSGEVIVRASLQIAEETQIGDAVIRGKLTFQACSQTLCKPPEEVTFPFQVSVAAPGTADSPLNRDLFENSSRQGTRVLPLEKGQETALWLTLIGLFLGGLALNLTPCIYPLIPITVSFFTGRAKRKTGVVIAHAALYMVGLALTNSALGLSAALTGAMLGSALQSPLVLLFVVLILVTLALSFFGVWDLRVPAGIARLASKDYGGALGSLFMGLTLGIVAAPCIGPFLLGLLAYVGQKGDAFLGFLYFFVLSLGLGLPLAILALFSGAISRMPLSGDWMLWMRKLMGWILVGMAAYMAGPLIPSETSKAALLSAVGLAAALHLGWLDTTGRRHKKFVAAKRVIGVAIAAVALISFFQAGFEKEGVAWKPYDPGLLLSASREGRPAMVDFYADWCGPCKELEKGPFREPEVVRLSRDFLTLRVDLTTKGKESDRLVAEYGVRGVPTIIFLGRDGKEQRDLRIESLVGRDEILERMKRLLGPGTLR